LLSQQLLYRVLSQSVRWKRRWVWRKRFLNGWLG
jgi:hypothetical protein